MTSMSYIFMKISDRKLAVANLHTAELYKLTAYENKLLVA